MSLHNLLVFLVCLIIGFLIADYAVRAARGADLKIEPPTYQIEKHKSVSADCDSLRNLNRANKGRRLSKEEKAVKAQLVTWYNANCRQARK